MNRICMRRLIFLLALSSLTLHGISQIGIGTATPNTSAQLDVTSTNKGFLPPRMTSAQRIAISSPAAGLMVYQTDGTSGLYYYNGSGWIYIINSTSTTGSGNVVFSTSPTLTTPIISTTQNTSSAGALLYGSGKLYYHNGSAWKTLTTNEVDNTYKLVSTGVARSVLTSQAIPSGTFTSLNNSTITVSVPSGFTESRIILQWNVWGAVASNANTDNIAGSLRYRINQTAPTSTTIDYVMMTGWFGYLNTWGGPSAITRYSAPVSYIIENPSAGTYTFSLDVLRENERGPIGDFFNWGISGTGQVFVR